MPGTYEVAAMCSSAGSSDTAAADQIGETHSTLLPAAVQGIMEHNMNTLPGMDGMQERFEVARSANYVQGNAAVRVHVICREETILPRCPA